MQPPGFGLWEGWAAVLCSDGHPDTWRRSSGCGKRLERLSRRSRELWEQDLKGADALGRESGQDVPEGQDTLSRRD